MTHAPIPLVDLRAQHEQVADEVRAGWASVLSEASFVLGQEVSTFENEFARFSGVSYCVGVANGTDALELALRAVGVRTGDEVVLPANTFIATAMAVVRAGATPVLVDVDDDTHLMDEDHAVAAFGPRTKAVIPVHLFGQVAPMERLVPAAKVHDVAVVEDAAQAHGARPARAGAGCIGDLGATSFYPGKNLGAYGDAGAVLTNRSDLAEQIRVMRNYGSDVKYHHPEVGFNSRLDTLQAVVLLAKLRRLAAWNDARRAAAAHYDELLADLGEVRRPVTLEGNEHVWHLYVVRVPERDRVLRLLHEAGIGAGVHYPVPIHLQGAFTSLGLGAGAFPIAERAATEILSLPMFPEITPGQQERVVDELQKALR